MTVLSILWKIKSNILRKISLLLTVKLLEGYIESGKHSCLQFRIRHEVMLGIIEFEVDCLVDKRSIGGAEIIENIEHLCIILHFCIFCLWWYKIHVIFTLIFGTA